MAVINGTSNADNLAGDAANDTINGLGGNDTIRGNGGADLLYGGNGHDHIYHDGHKGGLYGMNGNDYLFASKDSGAQVHMYGGSGDDTISMDLTNDVSWASRDGHHVFGGQGNDQFVFENRSYADGMLVGRIDDFDNSRDSIWIGGTQLDLGNLPSGVRVVEHLGQQWLVIDNKAAYALEGARKTTGDIEEDHFRDVEFSLALLASLPTVAYIDQLNYVEHHLYEDIENSLNIISVGAGTVNGSSSADRIYDGGGDSNTIYGNGGGDVIDANGGHDTVYGGSGDDMIAGGLDDDLIYGGTGNDTLYGGSEDDVIYGEDGNDSIFGGTGSDSLEGASGNDTLRAGTGDDTVRGQDGGDLIRGAAGNDYLRGGNGDDEIYGDNGDDEIYGDVGEDTIYAGSGTDTIIGGTEQDIVWGQGGADIFKFNTGHLIDWANTSGTTAERNDQLDRIEDFVIGEDKIDFSGFAGVSSRSDFNMWQTTIDGDVYFTLREGLKNLAL
ncbi:hypothetical protein M4578_18255 [Salipiger sp. P9]|uniref:calcium-binding protein n=1 Tax=Salipiger pentaromativorans TaxID=2943193 RepID=UPI0021581EA4|nr:calcium-binding protein [Salipiger pentaromativorans]MCR8549778.1 hypothetical protein [Salipiger pentaromativorans]